ncbi:MAG: alpha-glucosidase/alpha-galactosidase [Anaerolineae bacterium]|nr:alpha-glucosidase/alpha-galactosidase [Anaerolineae bacterium]
MLKIVIIGAASQSFGRGMIVDFLHTDELRGKDLTLWLVDIDQEALEKMRRFAERVKAHTGTDITIQATTDRTVALPGASYVLIAVSIHRYPLWEQDFRVPLSHGFRHPLGENGGPGALFHALRSLNLVMPICRDIERLCPDALVLNFTNPEARVLDAILHLTQVNAVGLCHGVFSAISFISAYLQIPIEQLEVTSAGMNHFYAILKAIDKETGQDLLPGLLEKLRNDDSLPPSVWKKFIDIFGWLTYRSDDHIGEYVSFGAEFTNGRWPYGLESRPIERTQPGPRFELDSYLDGSPLDDRALHRSGELAVPIICDIELNRHCRRDAVNVLNSDGYIANLPHTAVVEVPAFCDGKGVHPISVGSIVEAQAVFIRTQLSIQRLITEAWRTRSKNLLLQALLLDPAVNSILEAEKMLDEMLDLQQDFLPLFK